MLMKVCGQFWILYPGIEPRTSSAVGEYLNHLTTQYHAVITKLHLISISNNIVSNQSFNLVIHRPIHFFKMYSIKD